MFLFIGFVSGFFAGFTALAYLSTSRYLRRFLDIASGDGRVTLGAIRDTKARINMPEAAELARRVTAYDKYNKDAGIDDIL